MFYLYGCLSLIRLVLMLCCITAETETQHCMHLVWFQGAFQMFFVSDENDTVPAMLPSAQIACSLMCGCGDDTRLMKAGMAPPSTTAVVWSDVPEAMLVSAQAASNWIGGHWGIARKFTNL